MGRCPDRTAVPRSLHVALILLAGRIQSSSLRHAAWTSVLAAMLLMPLAPFVMPAVVAVPIPANALQDALALAEKFRDDPDYGTAIYKANNHPTHLEATEEHG